MISIYILTFVAVVLAWYFLGAKQRPKNFPPGPPGIPILGNALQLGTESFKVALAWKPKYGDIIGVQMGQYWTVFLNNPDDIREAFNKTEFSARIGFNFLMDKRCEEFNSGLVFTNGQKWLDHRRFTLKTLRDFGFGKRTSEGIIMEEVKELTSRLKEMSGKPFSSEHLFNAPMFNVIWSIVAGERYDYDDPGMDALIKIFQDCFDSALDGIRPFYFLFPALLNLKKPLSFIFGDNSDKFREILFKFLRKTIDEHRKTLQVGEPRDYIDAMLNESSKIDDYQEIDMLATLVDFFISATETTSTTLLWSFFLLAKYPEIQEKFADEISTVVGNRNVAVSDKLSLPFVEATIMEIMRLSHIAPVGALHGTNQDVVYKGHFLPKNTIVVGNLYACLMDADTWGDPNVFRPERFLSQDGKSMDRNRAWLPFGAGKRACLGESLARDEIFLFLTNLIQSFSVTMPDDEPPHTTKGKFNGATNRPEPHRVLVNIRN